MFPYSFEDEDRGCVDAVSGDRTEKNVPLRELESTLLRDYEEIHPLSILTC